MDIVVVGVGGMGRETAAWALDSGAPVIGFVDDDEEAHDLTPLGLPVLGTLASLRPDRHSATIAIGPPQVREQVHSRLVTAETSLTSVQHPTAVVHPSTAVSQGCIIGPNVTMTVDGAVGTAAIINFGAQIGHDARIGEFAFIGPGAVLGGAVTIGRLAFVGAGATVLPGISIGDGATIGAGAVVTRDVSASTTVIGIPARVLHADNR